MTTRASLFQQLSLNGHAISNHGATSNYVVFCISAKRQKDLTAMPISSVLFFGNREPSEALIACLHNI